MRTHTFPIVLTSVVLTVALSAQGTAPAPIEKPKGPFDGLVFRNIGPATP